MSRVPLTDPETATGSAANLLAATQRALGITPNLARAMANSPAVLRGYLDLQASLREGALPAEDRARIELFVAEECASDYGLSAHTYLGTRVAGLTAEEATDARFGRSAHPRSAAVLRLAVAVLRSNGAVRADEFAAACRWLTYEQVIEVVAHVAVAAFTAWLTKACQVDIDWPLVRHATPSR